MKGVTLKTFHLLVFWVAAVATASAQSCGSSSHGQNSTNTPIGVVAGKSMAGSIGLLYSDPGPADWWMFGREPMHNRRSPYGFQEDTYVAVKWFPPQGQVPKEGFYSSPAIADDGTVYIGNDDHRLYAITNWGQEKWSFDTGGGIWSSPAIGPDGTVYFGSYDGYFYALNPDGTLKWRYSTSPVDSSPAIATNGTIYVVGWNGYLFALNPNGTLKWQAPVEASYNFSSPAIWWDAGAGVRVIYAGSGSKLFAYADYGAFFYLRWAKELGAFYQYSSPAVGADGTVYIGTLTIDDEDSLWAVHPDGSTKWQYVIGREIASSPAVAHDGTIYIGEFSGSNDGRMLALNPDGTLKWQYVTNGVIWSSPALDADGNIYFGTTSHYPGYTRGRIYALRSDGTRKWYYSTDGGVDSSPAIGLNPVGGETVVYVGCADGSVYRIVGAGS